MTRLRAGPEKCPRPVGETGIAGAYGRRPNHTATSDNFKASVEAERRLLALGFLQPGELNDTRYQLGLRSDDFTWIGHGFLFEYIVDCADRGSNPDFNECVRLGTERGVEIDESCLHDILFGTDFRDGELVNYAHDVLRASQNRSETLFRDLCRDTIRAVNRGLRIDAERRCYRIRKPARRSTAPARPRRPVRPATRRKVVCCG